MGKHHFLVGGQVIAWAVLEFSGCDYRKMMQCDVDFGLWLWNLWQQEAAGIFHVCLEF